MGTKRANKCQTLAFNRNDSLVIFTANSCVATLDAIQQILNRFSKSQSTFTLLHCMDTLLDRDKLLDIWDFSLDLILFYTEM